jgi:hypothetical protein
MTAYDKDNFAKHAKTVAKRSSGIAKAVTRLTKEQLEKKGRFVSGPVKQPFKSNTILTSVKEGFKMGRGNVHEYDRNPAPRDGSELENTPSRPKTELQKRLKTALTDLGNKLKQTHPKLKEDYADPITIIKKGTNIKKKISADAYNVFKHHGFRKEEKNSQEYDYEGDMAKSDLRSIMHNAKELHDMIEDNTNLAEWCQSKITLSEDYLSTVTNYMRSEMNEEVKKNEYHIAGKHKFPTKDEHAVTVKHTESGREHVHSGKGKYLSKLIKTRYNINHYFEEVELDEMVVVKTNKPIGTRVADIGPGGKEYNVKTNKAWDDSKKKQPQGADFAAQRRKERLAKNGRMDEKENLPGLWANIHAKRKRGESPAKPGDKGYPKTLNIEEVDLNEGRPSQRHPLEGHEYHKKSDEALVHIAKDAHAAAEAMKSHNTDAENKYRDQANDSATVRHFRKKSGMPDWYKKKYGHVKESTDNAPFNKPYNKDSGTTTDKSGAKHTPMSKARHLARQAMNKTTDKPVKESASEPTEGEMKGKQEYSRKAQIVMNASNGKKSDSSDKFQKDPE